ncbi:MAG TPA: hypothetical protein DCE43_16580, partial [Planctomycetaceae bacterium]|nr:hypothetical protein [Planctomycetaceae bacterium]
VTAVVTSSDSTSNIHSADYVGPDRCRKCHPRNHQDWNEHAHRLMNTVATRETVRGEVSGRATLHQDGGRAMFFQDPGASGTARRWWMRLVRGDVDRTYRITQTIGSRFFQYYVGRLVAGPEPAEHQY